MTKRLFDNENEHKTDNILRAGLEKEGYRVCPKIRLADIIKLDKKKLSRQAYSYALKAHFDFTIYDKNNRPAFSVEFDGYYHYNDDRAKKNDKLKEQICLQYAYPLLRIDAGFFKKVNSTTILSWLAKTWCFNVQFYEQQQKKFIPQEEDFDYFSIAGVDSNFNLIFPYDPFREYRLFFAKMFSEKKIISRQPYHLIWRDADGFIHCLKYLLISKEKAIKQSCKVKGYSYFPVTDDQLCEAIALFLIYEKYVEYQKSSCHSIDVEELYSELKAIGDKYECSVFSDVVKIDTPFFKSEE